MADSFRARPELAIAGGDPAGRAGRDRVYAVFIVCVRRAAAPCAGAGGVAASIGVYRVDAAAFDEDSATSGPIASPRPAAPSRAPIRRSARPRTRITSPTPSSAKAGPRLRRRRAPRQAEVALQRALAASPDGVVRVDDPDLALKSSDEMAEALARGLRRDASDLNPLSMLEKRP
jgi:hypothetical protein